jgi:hypothetical protein
MRTLPKCPIKLVSDAKLIDIKIGDKKIPAIVKNDVVRVVPKLY